MKKRTLFLIGTAAAAGIYSAITGKGLFNKPRFKEQHERVANYVETHYPNAVYISERGLHSYRNDRKRLGNGHKTYCKTEHNPLHHP